jgi:hypothetical protein
LPPRLVWEALDRATSAVTQARLWLLDLIHGPEPPTPADEKREVERYWLLPVGR